MRLFQDHSVTASDVLYVNDETVAAPEDQMDLSPPGSLDTPTVSVPPSHLVARFYPIPSGRKRTSASSSRRSSISSLHSHHSGRSAHGGPQSTHIAQHLRRASIIESRKARLADRAAHAEKVRLRAAIAKATPRHSISEERALAAQQTRERLLAEITAKCEEEVKRAKKRAEEMKERKAAEQARLKEDMQERHAEAEKRRLLYQRTIRRPRTSSLAPVDERKGIHSCAPPSPEAAAKIIQRSWRSRQAALIIQNFNTFKLNLAHVREMKFEDVRDLLYKEDTLVSTAKVLSLLGVEELANPERCKSHANVRSFLSAFLILAFPMEVLNARGEEEEDLVGSAQSLLETFEPLITQPTLFKTSRVTQLESYLTAFSNAYDTFLSTFNLWKARDSSVLVEKMVKQFVELDAIWQTVKGDRAGGVSQDYHEGIQHNQALILSRLQKMVGRETAHHLIKTAVTKSRRAQHRSSTQGGKPRADPTPIATTPENNSGPSNSTTVPRGASIYGHTDIHHPPPNQTRGLGDEMTVLPDNRTLVHELAINKEYRIERKPARRAVDNVYAAMRKDVEAGLGTQWTVAMAEFIRERLNRILNPGNSLHDLISERLDAQTIRNQCEAGLFSYDSFFDFMGKDIMPRLCAPARDADVKALNEDLSGDVIDRLERLLRLVDMTSLDLSNYMLQIATPQLIEQAPTYEKHAFSQDLSNGKVTLQRSRNYWTRARRSVVEEIRKRDSSQSDVKPPPSRVYVEGLVDLVFMNAPFQEHIFPEILHLDHDRLLSLHGQAMKITASASILLTAKNLLKRDAGSQWKAAAERLLYMEDMASQPDRIVSLLESARPMPTPAKTQLLSTVKRIVSQLGGGQEHEAAIFTDPVSKVFLSRLRSHVLGRLSASSISERSNAATTANQNLADAGLPEFVSEVGAMVELLLKVRECDLASHGQFWEQVQKEVEEAETGQME